jgi:hypothetical protein
MYAQMFGPVSLGLVLPPLVVGISGRKALRGGQGRPLLFVQSSNLSAN